MRHLVLWWLLVEALGFLSLPLVFRLFSREQAHGYPFSKVLTLLWITYLSWLCSYARVLPLHAGLPAAIGVLAVLAGWRAWKDREALSSWWLEGGWRAVVLLDAFWSAAFLFFAWQRSLAPEIFGAEKYMDFAFLNTLTRTEYFPPEDPWMAGEALNYYYFGYLVFADLVRISGIPSHIAYNLCIATIGGVGFAEFAALGWRLAGRMPFGLLSGACAMLLGNLDGFLQVLEKRSLTPMDYWRSSRVVARGDTINEFPFFSTIHGDLHPHFMVLPVTGLFLGILLDRALFPRRDEVRIDTFARAVPLAFAGFALATMVVISPWELPVGTLLLFLLLGRHLPLWPPLTWERIQLLLQVAAVLVASYLLFSPFYLHFTAPTGGGVGFRVARTSLAEFLTVFGHLLFPLGVLAILEGRRIFSATAELRHLVMAVAALAMAAAAVAGNAVLPLLALLGAALVAVTHTAQEHEWRTPLTLAFVALVALLACELVFLRDSYGEKLYRMNTVFKLYFQAWLLLSLAAPWALAVLLRRPWSWAGAPRVLLASAAALGIAACAYPLGVTATRLQYARAHTLDGTEYIAREHPDDFAAIEFLRRSVQGLPVVLEATGDPYSYYARFASNTGLPTVLGWANHEGLWRGDHRAVDERRRHIQLIYSATSLDDASALLERYRVRYIVVGELERKDHPGAGLAKFAALREVFRSGNTAVYER